MDAVRDLEPAGWAVEYTGRPTPFNPRDGAGFLARGRLRSRGGSGGRRWTGPLWLRPAWSINAEGAEGAEICWKPIAKGRVRTTGVGRFAFIK